MNKQIMVLGVPYTIIENLEVLDVHQSYGLHFDWRQEIHVYSLMKEEKKQVILIHELLHAITASLGYEEISADEKFIHSLAEALPLTFKIQPKYIK